MLPSRWFTVAGLPDFSREMQEEVEELELEGEVEELEEGEERVSVDEKVSQGRHLPTTRLREGSTATRSTPSS